jgi:hypothetical protein
MHTARRARGPLGSRHGSPPLSARALNPINATAQIHLYGNAATCAQTVPVSAIHQPERNPL